MLLLHAQRGLLPQESAKAYCSPFDIGWIEDDFPDGMPKMSPVCDDLYALHPSAEEADIATAISKLTIAFPNQSPEFWAILANRFAELHFSKERLKYILHIALDTDRLTNQYRYGRLTIGDFTSISRPLRTYSFLEAEREPLDKAYVYCNLEKPNLCQITTVEEAKMSGLKWIPFLKCYNM